MRAFLALAPPEAVRTAIWQRVEAERSEGGGARWVREEGVHLTLEFLGEVAETVVGALEGACRAASVACATFTARLSGGGWFPPGRPARALWVGLEPAAELMRLQASVAAAAWRAIGAVSGSPGSAGSAGSSRPFHPHLTLARCDPPWPRERATRFVERLRGLEALSFPVRETVLMRSQLGRGGSRYEAVARFALGAAG